MNIHNIKKEIIEKACELKNTSGRVDVVALANMLGIKVYTAKGMDYPSIILFDKDKNEYKIFVNADENSNRQRFSVSHEIAHFILHKDKIQTYGCVGRKNCMSLTSSEEKEADTFGAEILMPHKCMIDFLNKINVKKDDVIDIDLVKKVAQEFEVSLIAACMRLRELGYYVGYISI